MGTADRGREQVSGMPHIYNILVTQRVPNKSSRPSDLVMGPRMYVRRARRQGRGEGRKEQVTGRLRSDSQIEASQRYEVPIDWAPG